MKNNEVERPLSIIVVSVILVLFQVGAIATRIFNGGNFDTDALIYTSINSCVLVGVYGVWNMKKWGMWVVIACMTAIAVMHTQMSDRPIRDFFYTGFPMILMVFACMYPHRSRMN